MIRSILKRLMLSVPTILGTTLLTFLVMEAAPGNPAAIAAGIPGGGKRSREIEKRLEEFMGLKKPTLERYLLWARKALLLEFGRSLDGEPVMDKITRALPPTLILGAASFIIGIAVSILLGVFLARIENTFPDKLCRAVLVSLYSMPSWLLGLLLIMVFGVVLEAFPFQGWRSPGWEGMSFLSKVFDVFKHSFLILLAVLLPGLAHDTLFIRQAMAEELEKHYVTSLRAFGLPEKTVIWKHAFRNAAVPIATLIGVSVPGILSGSVILEQVFSWPGMGRLFFTALSARDYPVIMAITSISAFMVIAGNLLADVLCIAWDPRLRHEGTV